MVPLGGLIMSACVNAIDKVLLSRIRGELLEMPGLKVTSRQARRLWNLEAPICDCLLDELVEAGFLHRAADGSFIRTNVAP